jgi:hypothetical protein
MSLEWTLACLVGGAALAAAVANIGSGDRLTRWFSRPEPDLTEWDSDLTPSEREALRREQQLASLALARDQYMALHEARVHSHMKSIGRNVVPFTRKKAS